MACFCTAGRGRRERLDWGLEFTGTVIAAFLGYYLHGFPMRSELYTGLWCLLYIVMFSITLGIYMLIMPHLGNEDYSSDTETRFVKRAFPVLLVISEILCMLKFSWDIYGFALFSLMLAVSLEKKAIRGERKDPRFLLTVLLLLLAAAAQGFKFIFSEYSVVASHIFLIAALALLFDFALHITADKTE